MISNGHRGLSLIGVLILCGIIILVLGYFDIRVKDVVESPGAQENVEYVREGTKSFWDRYLREPAAYLWHDVWVDIFWQGFINNMKRIRDGKPTDWDNAAGKVNFGY